MTSMISGGGGISTQCQRVMFFIDGKNLAMRYKEMKDTKKVPQNTVVEGRDDFVWTPVGLRYPSTATRPQVYQLIRAYYFTSLSGDEACYNSDVKKISSLSACTGMLLQLSPNIHRKFNSMRSCKGDDIALSVIALHHAYSGHIDIAHFFTGDGDFIPLIQEIKRLGIYVAVSSLTSGLNDNLKTEADFFCDLDNLYFKTPDQM